ncbi:MAG: hypothetical protein ACKV1O_04105, partial [Saprospiraceae bacterium]
AKLRDRFGKNLPSDKSYLYDAILRSMRDYRSANSRSARIKEMILDARYLYERGLYGQSEGRLREAKAMAKDLGDHLALLEINKEESKIASEGKEKNYRQVIEVLILEKEEEVALMMEEYKYLDSCYRLLGELTQRFQFNNDADKNRLIEKFAFLQDPDTKVKSMQAERRYYQDLAMYNQLLGQTDKVFLYYSKVMEWWDNNPKYKDEEFYRFIIDVSNFLYALFRKEQYQHIPDLLHKLDQENPVYFHDRAILFQKASINKLMYYINTGAVDQLEKLEPEIEAGMHKYDVNPKNVIAIIGNLAIGLFVIEKFSKCEVWCRKLIKSSAKMKPKLDIQKGMHLLRLVAVLESGDLDKLENAIRSTYRFLYQVYEGKTDGFEFSVLSYIRELVNAPTGEARSIYRNIREFLLEFKNSPLLSAPFGMDELLLAWANHKIERKPIVSYILKK